MATTRTGTPSGFGGFTGYGSVGGRSIMSPWGNNFGRTGVGGGKVGGSSRRQNTPDPSLYSMDYTANDPLQWPVMPDGQTGLRRGPTSGMTQAKADRNNLIVNHAFLRTTGLS